MESLLRGVQERSTQSFSSRPAVSAPYTKGSGLHISNPVDEALEELVRQHRAKIRVIGLGGGGGNSISRMSDVGIVGVETIAMNTDAQDLLYARSDRKLLVGRELTAGLGAGSNPQVGADAGRESEKEIKEILQGSDIVFLTCGMGGGTGTGLSSVVADVAKKLNILTVAIVTLPFAMEGQRRYDNAIGGLEELEKYVDTLIVIPNDKLLELCPGLPLHTAFKVADEILTNAVKGIAELVTKAGLVNLDFADIKAVMGGGGVAMIGLGEANSEKRALESVEKAIQNPLLDVDITGASGALINVTGGNNLTLDEARQIVETVTERLDEDARVIWGAQVSEDLDDTVRTLLIVTGVHSPQIFGERRKKGSLKNGEKKSEMGEELGIDFFE